MIRAGTTRPAGDVALLSTDERDNSCLRFHQESASDATSIHYSLLHDQAERIANEIKARFKSVKLLIEFSPNPRIQSSCDSILDLLSQDGTPVTSVAFWWSANVTQDLLKGLDSCIRRNLPCQLLGQVSPAGREGQGGPYAEVLNLRVVRRHLLASKFIEDTLMLLPTELPGSVYRYRVVDERYWYWDERGAGSYVSLIHAPGYSPLPLSLANLRGRIEDILHEVFADIRRRNGSSTVPIDFVALGVGSAEKEKLILNSLKDRYRQIAPPAGQRRTYIHYVPVDVSFPLLADSLGKFLSDVDFESYNKPPNQLISVAPVLGDFFQIPKTLIGTNRFKFIAALGVVYNAPIPEIFDAFQRLMTEDSYLLIDVEFADDRKDPEIREPYENEYSDAFFYHPLELLHQASSSADTFKWDENQPPQEYGVFSGYSVDRRRIQPSARMAGQKGSNQSNQAIEIGNGKVKTEVIGPDEVDDFLDRHGFPARAKEKIRVGPPDLKSRTVVIFWEVKEELHLPIEPVVLGYSTRFVQSQFKKYLEDRGFQVLKPYIDYDSDKPSKPPLSGYYLLKLK